MSSYRAEAEEKVRAEWSGTIDKMRQESDSLRSKLGKSEANRYQLAHQLEDIIKNSGLKVDEIRRDQDIKELDFETIMPVLRSQLHDRLQQAYHFDMMMKAVRSNEIVEGAWKKFVMTLRLCGFDKEETNDHNP